MTGPVNRRVTKVISLHQSIRESVYCSRRAGVHFANHVAQQCQHQRSLDDGGIILIDTRLFQLSYETSKLFAFV